MHIPALSQYVCMMARTQQAHIRTVAMVSPTRMDVALSRLSSCCCQICVEPRGDGGEKRERGLVSALSRAQYALKVKESTGENAPGYRQSTHKQTV